MGRHQDILLITEHGLYALVSRSKMPRAIELQHRVYDILVQIRNRGYYEISPRHMKQMMDRDQLAKMTGAAMTVASQYGTETFSRPKVYSQQYHGMYQMSLEEILQSRGITQGSLRDYMGAPELAANIQAWEIFGSKIINEYNNGIDVTANFIYKTAYDAGQQVRIFRESNGLTMNFQNSINTNDIRKDVTYTNNQVLIETFEG
jgi:hypothetical protein